LGQSLRRKNLKRYLPGDHLVPKRRLAGFRVILNTDFTSAEMDGNAFSN